MRDWISHLFSEPGAGGPSSRRVGMAAAVVVALGLCIYATIARVDIPPGVLQKVRRRG